MPVPIPECSPGLSRSGESLPHQYSKRGGGGLASEEKVIFVLKLLGPVLPVHPQDSTERIRSRDKSYWKAASGPLTASVAKGRNPLHLQSE